MARDCKDGECQWVKLSSAENTPYFQCMECSRISEMIPGVVIMACGSCGQELPPAGESWVFALSLVPPSQNVVSGNKGNRGARAKYKKYRDDYQLLLQAWMNELKIPDATGRRRVSISRRYAGRSQRRDRGNLIGGCKPLLDAMTLVGLIVDDKEEFLQDHYYQIRADINEVEIRIEEMEMEKDDQ